MNDDDYPVGQVAGLAHVSVRTLHRYDELGLLRPSHRTGAGHRRYSAADLQRLAGFVAAITAGEPADGERARQLAEEHRQQICRWFYDCTYEIHRGIGELYVSDPAWIEQWEGTAPGFSRYVRAAIVANADARAG